MAAPDYSELFASAQLSDLNIVLAEKHSEDTDKAASSTGDAQPASKRRRTRASAAAPEEEAPNAADASSSKKLLPRHSIVLFGCSTFCKTKLQNWSSGTGGKLEICITVPAGQLAVGELLVQCMYAAQPETLVTKHCQEQLLLLLADQYGVAKVLAAVTAAFASIAPADLQWETLQALYALPPGCADMDACKGVYVVAGDKLQQELGDLELVWADAGKQQRFLALPQPALQQLLQDPRTRVASENTVFYSVEHWQQQQQQQQQQALDALGVRELLQLVRMQHCTCLYVATIIARSSLATTYFSAAELAEACVLAGAAPQLAQALLDKSSIASKMPAWKAAKRPSSAVLQLDMQWQLPLQQLRVALEKHLQDTSKARFVNGSNHPWRGTCYNLGVKLHTLTDAANAEPSTDLGIFMGMASRRGAVCKVTYTIAARASTTPNTQPPAVARDVVFGPVNATWGNNDGKGRSSVVKFGVLSGWQQAKSKLRELGLVHSDGWLHLQGLMTDVV